MKQVVSAPRYGARHFRPPTRSSMTVSACVRVRRFCSHSAALTPHVHERVISRRRRGPTPRPNRARTRRDDRRWAERAEGRWAQAILTLRQKLGPVIDAARRSSRRAPKRCSACCIATSAAARAAASTSEGDDPLRRRRDRQLQLRLVGGGLRDRRRELDIDARPFFCSLRTPASPSTRRRDAHSRDDTPRAEGFDPSPARPRILAAFDRCTPETRGGLPLRHRRRATDSSASSARSTATWRPAFLERHAYELARSHHEAQ